MLRHMSTSNTINDIHADEYGNACRYYLPSGIPQSVQLGGVHIPADAHAPSHRSDTRSSVIPAWWRAHPRISPLMHTLICIEVTRCSELCRLRIMGPSDIPAGHRMSWLTTALPQQSQQQICAQRVSALITTSLMVNLCVHAGEPFN